VSGFQHVSNPIARDAVVDNAFALRLRMAPAGGDEAGTLALWLADS
jgi:hypothetical protein